MELPTSDPEAAAASLPPVDSISAWQTLTGGAVGGRRASLRSTVGGGGGEGKGGGEGVGERDARTVLHLSNQSAMTFFSSSIPLRTLKAAVPWVFISAHLHQIFLFDVFHFLFKV